jgi:hypothetical protein
MLLWVAATALRCAQDAGLKVDQVAPRLSFFFAVGLNFFEEIAKLRAARRLWARMVKEKFAPQKESSLVLRWVCCRCRQGACLMGGWCLGSMLGIVSQTNRAMSAGVSTCIHSLTHWLLHSCMCGERDVVPIVTVQAIADPQSGNICRVGAQ